MPARHIHRHHAPPVGTRVARLISSYVMRRGAEVIAARHLDVAVEGLEHLPRSGPVLIAARHFHNLYDGVVLRAFLPRPVHIFVALDWAPNPWIRRGMELLCDLAEWPATLRADGLTDADGVRPRRAYRPAEGSAYLRRALRDAVRILRTRRMLVVFPEGYPNVDPLYTPKTADESWLPFQTGFLRLVEQAQRHGRGHTCIPIVPVGFAYKRGTRWRVTLRLGAPLRLDAATDRAALLRLVEAQVHTLSAPAPDQPSQ